MIFLFFMIKAISTFRDDSIAMQLFISRDISGSSRAQRFFLYWLFYNIHSHNILIVFEMQGVSRINAKLMLTSVLIADRSRYSMIDFLDIAEISSAFVFHCLLPSYTYHYHAMRDIRYFAYSLPT